MSLRAVDVEVCCKTLSLHFHQRFVGDESCVVWDAAIVLSKYLQRLTNANGDSLFQNRKVLELGAGVGCVGLTAATLGAEVLVTDLPDALPLLRLNISDNKAAITSQGGFATAEQLTWGDLDSDIIKTMTFDYVLISDSIYYEEAIDPLITTLINVNQTSTKIPLIFISQELRDSSLMSTYWKSFYGKLRRYFDITIIPKEEQHPEFNSNDIIILKCRKKTPFSSEHTIL